MATCVCGHNDHVHGFRATYDNHGKKSESESACRMCKCTTFVLDDPMETIDEAIETFGLDDHQHIGWKVRHAFGPPLPAAPGINLDVSDLVGYVMDCPCQLCRRIAKTARHAANYAGRPIQNENPKTKKPSIKSDSEIPDSLEDMWGTIGKGPEDNE